jgi:methionyl-tRNA synthetase
MPAISASICSQVNIDSVLIPDVWLANTVKPGHHIGQAKKLFDPIKPEKEEEWREKFGGEEARRQKEEKAAKAAKNKLNRAKKKSGLSKQAGAANVEAGVKVDVNGVEGLTSEMTKSLRTS